MLPVVLLVASVLHAAEVHVNITDHSAERRCSKDAVVTAVADVKRTDAVPREGSAVLTLDEGSAWSVRAAAGACWSKTATWIQGAGAGVAVELFPAATLQGTFSAGGQNPPAGLAASAFRIAPQGTMPSRLSEAEPLDCGVDFPKWSCSAPAGLPVDVRLEPAGFAPIHLWHTVLKPDERRDAGAHELAPGASIAGWVEDPEGKPLAGAVVSMAPLQPEHPDATRAVAAEYRAKSDARGFFQITRIVPGDYRLVSRAEKLAPAVVPAVTIRPFTASTWPRALRHAAAVTFRLTVQPAKSAGGSAWNVVLNERIPLVPGSPPASVTLTPDGDGAWSAGGLRPDRYELVIKDAGDAVVERREIDLSEGSPRTLAVAIDAIPVAGIVRTGEEPLAGAEIRFTSETGKRLFVTADGNGRFTAAFPAAGRWKPLVYPFGKLQRAQVRARPVEITKDTSEVEVLLPGGRLRGRVVTRTGAPAKAAVHVVMEKHGGTELVAQQITAGDGRFDFLGLAAATYAVSAEADAGASPRPLETALREDESKELEIVVEPYQHVRGTVRTPDGRPASGAIVRISLDGGVLWTDLVAGVEGTFEYVVPGGVSEVEVVVLSYSHPSPMLRVPAGARGPIMVTLMPRGGVLRVEPDRAYVFRQNVVAPLSMFYLPSNAGVTPMAHLEPGSYSVCPQPRVNADCRDVLIAPGTSITVDFTRETAGEKTR